MTARSKTWRCLKAKQQRLAGVAGRHSDSQKTCGQDPIDKVPLWDGDWAILTASNDGVTTPLLDARPNRGGGGFSEAVQSPACTYCTYSAAAFLAELAQGCC